MSIVTRSDGVQFVVQAYRELLSPARRSVLMQEIRMLAEQHGQYVAVSKLVSGMVEATFSTEPGYLFGESVWEYFGRPQNLIFCEQIEDSGQVYLVVIRDGSIHIDAKLQAIQVRAELLPLMTGELSYQIVTYGDVPLSDVVRPNCFTFPANMLTAFEKLGRPLFPSLPLLKNAQLQSLPLALKSTALGRNTTPWLAGFLICLLVIGGWWLYTPTAPVPEKKSAVSVSAPAKPVRSAYLAALTSPAPERIMDVVASVIGELYAIPGWRMQSTQFQDQKFTVSVASDGGDMEALASWAKVHGFQLRLQANAVELTRLTPLAKRHAKMAPRSSQQNVLTLIDRFDRLLQRRSVSVGAVETRGDAQKTAVTVHLFNVSPSLLELVGDEMEHMPVVIKSVQMQMAQGGLLNGTLQLAVWGGSHDDG